MYNVQRARVIVKCPKTGPDGPFCRDDVASDARAKPGAVSPGCLVESAAEFAPVLLCEGMLLTKESEDSDAGFSRTVFVEIPVLAYELNELIQC